MALKDAPRCTHVIRRTGNRCLNPARTGYAVCSKHGAGTRLAPGGRPPTHGRYSLIKRESLRGIAEAMEADPDPLNIVPELNHARALYIDFINRYDEYTTALLAWHSSYTAAERPLSEDRLLSLETVVDELEALLGPADLDEYEEGDEGSAQRRAIMESRKLIADLRAPNDGGKPRQIMDIADAWRILSEVTKIAERIERIRAANAISRPDLMRLMGEMGRVVARYVPDEATREKIQDAWLSIRA